MLYRYSVRYLFLALAAGCMLNLNGVGVLVIGINQLYSPVLLLASLLILSLAYFRRLPFSQELAIYFAALIFYLIFGAAILIFTSENAEQLSNLSSLIKRYFTASLVILAAFFGTLIAYEKQLNPMKIVLILAAMASVFVPFGAMLNMSGNIVVDSQRGAGLFGNPNEAGIIAAVGFALTHIVVSHRILKVLFSVFFVTMAMLTFSKTSLVMILLIYVIQSLFNGRFSIGIARTLIAMITIILSLALFKQDIVGQFDGQQAKRVEQVINIILLQSSSETVESSRGYLWRQGLEIIEDRPLTGSGLGALHSMQGAAVSVNNKVAQGVHNSYLLKLGDAGVVALVLFLSFLVVVSYRAFQLSHRHLEARFCLLYLFIFMIDCISSHNVELLRFHNFLLGFSLALLFVAKHHRIRGRQ